MPKKIFNLNQVILITLLCSLVIGTLAYLVGAEKIKLAPENPLVGYVTYRIDEINHCSWKDSKVNGSTLIGSTEPDKMVQISRAEEKQQLADWEREQTCAYLVE